MKLILILFFFVSIATAQPYKFIFHRFPDNFKDGDSLVITRDKSERTVDLQWAWFTSVITTQDIKLPFTPKPRLPMSELSHKSAQKVGLRKLNNIQEAEMSKPLEPTDLETAKLMILGLRAEVERLRKMLDKQFPELYADLERMCKVDREQVEQIDALTAEREELKAEVERLKEQRHRSGVAMGQMAERVDALTAERDRFREQRDNESWMHAACLSIAEGIAGWKEMPPENDSLAMIKVRQLRQDYEAEKRENAELKKAINDVSDIVASIWGAGKITEAQVVELKSIALRCHPKETK